MYDASKDRPRKEKNASHKDGEHSLGVMQDGADNRTMVSEKINDNSANNEKEKNEMEKTMKIEGMMCPHCEAAVKGALEALDGVSCANVSHEADRAVVVMENEVADEILKEAVEAKDYKVISIA
jgi:Cu2+-exporting ATPase